MKLSEKTLFSQNKINFNKSILVKSGIFFILIITIILVASTYLVNKKATRTLELYSQDRLKYASNIVERAFYSMLKEVENDISLISKNITLKHFVNDTSKRDLEQFDNLFPIILSEKPNYFQVRLLDIDDDGKELVKYEKLNDSIFKTPENKLQYKGDKNYYKKALSIIAPFYFSEINLNEEYGKISTPLKPTLRAIGKIFDKRGDPKFMIIINVDLSNFYEEISQINKQEIKNVIIDSLGEFKYHNDFKNCFGIQRKTDITFEKNFNVKLDSLFNSEKNKNTLKDANNQIYIYRLKKIMYSSGLNKLYLVTIASQKSIFANVTHINKYSLYLVLIICLILFIIIFSYAYYFAKKIRKVTSAISSYNNKTFSASYLKDIKDRKDEIGLLARTYIKMKNDIDSNITKLKTSLKREKAAIQEKDEFLQNMGHEIRTPLNTILGLTDLLTRNKPLEAQKPIISALERSTRNLNGLMHDILDEQKLIQGKIILTPTDANMHELLKNIVSNYMFDAVKKGLVINLNTSESIRKRNYLIDILRFEQIITNLLINAIKYTSKGSIDINASIDNNQLFVEVADTGEGINDEYLNKIKTRFYRINNTQTNKEEGFGLGLSIVMQIIDLFKGNLEVSSSPKKGSVFRFSIPIKASASRNVLTSKNKVLYPSYIEGSKILHIEDDISSLFMIKNTFETLGIKLKQVSTIDNLEVIFKSSSFDLILSDLMLNSKNITNYVKNNLSKHNIPILILSALSGFASDNLEIVFLQKPIELDTLTDYIVTLICKNIYDVPKLENIYKQYDNDGTKTKKYLNILIQEFDQYHSKILAVLESKNQKEWNAIKHKIITHINSLKLNQMNTLFQEDISNISLEKSQFLIDNLRYLLCYLRNEQRTNLVN